MTLDKKIAKLIKSWDKIPDSFKYNLQTSNYRSHGTIPGLNMEDHVVVLLLDRQKHSVEQSYDFDEERISVNKKGQVIYGFSSGCSCPSPWDDDYPACYNLEKTWKEFVLKDTSGFDEDWSKACEEKIDEVLKDIK